MSAETLSQAGLWGVVAMMATAIVAMASGMVYLYRDKKKSDEARITTLNEVLPLVRDLLAFLKRR